MATIPSSLYVTRARQGAVLPGLLLCLAVTAAALFAERIEAALTGRAWIEALVLAILVGTAIRTFWKPAARFEPGIAFSAKILLEVAVMLLGATVSLGALAGAGGMLVGGIVLTVFVAIGASYGLGRLLGLPPRMATLIACGNAICGNSAIAAVAPVIDADCEEVAASIAYTAVFGVVVVLLLPFVVLLLKLDPLAGGALAGLTVYAVPQVIAAAAPLGPVAVQLGTIVKLVRVLMLGPVVMTLSLIVGRQKGGEARGAMPIGRMLPWFILGFLALAALRSIGVVPTVLVAPAGKIAGWLTIVSMAALGLGVDMRSVTAAGPRVMATVMLSLLLLGAIALIVLRIAGLA
ncbi:MAG: putative sulfate exporter family transporter [Sphingomonas bacterium]|nr:putative sulfate exporter family transporter [Sphingomonas bacterium]